VPPDSEKACARGPVAHTCYPSARAATPTQRPDASKNQAPGRRPYTRGRTEVTLGPLPSPSAIPRLLRWTDSTPARCRRQPIAECDAVRLGLTSISRDCRPPRTTTRASRTARHDVCR